ncbi:MAG: hypothetical protein IJ109_09830 [Firmicutes bacterium]|nr:hypothetical protein [Bacillota bacterium]MBQ9059524.1 hypothetical protein [Bacillota bacterium]
MKKKLAYLLILAVAVSFIPTSVFAQATKVKSTTYGVIKSGKTVYCAADTGIYKVKLKKNGKPKSKKKLVKMSKKYGYQDMIKKGKYIYFLKSAAEEKTVICRIKTSGGKVKTLAKMDGLGEYAIKGSKIYYIDEYETDSDDVLTKICCKVMNLDGSSKKDTDILPVQKYKKSNKKGYKLDYTASGNKIIDLLRTPKGKITLGSY